MSNLRTTFAKSVLDIGLDDDKFVLVVGDISHGLLKDFRGNFPDRYFNIGISEPGMISVIAGLSKSGLIPLVHTIAPFLIERSFEQIKLDFGYQKVSGNFLSVGSSFDYSKLGCSHHTYSDVSMMSQIPGSKVFLPSSDIELEILLKDNYAKKSINYFRLTENPHGVELNRSEIHSGKGIIVKEGTDVTIFALGPQLRVAVSAGVRLQKEGINAEVVYFHTFKPFDNEIVLNSLKKTGAFVTLDELSTEHNLFNLVQNAIFGKMLVSGLQFGVNDFVRYYGKYREILEEIGLGEQTIVDSIIELVAKKLVQPS
jgi:transketolase